MGGVLGRLFKVKKLELVLVGIENRCAPRTEVVGGPLTDPVCRAASRSGKSTLLNMMAMGTSIQTVPTVGLSVKTMKHAGVSMKVSCPQEDWRAHVCVPPNSDSQPDRGTQAWDLGGSAQFRSEWGRYPRGCDVILFLVDTNDVSRRPTTPPNLGSSRDWKVVADGTQPTMLICVVDVLVYLHRRGSACRSRARSCTRSWRTPSCKRCRCWCWVTRSTWSLT
jgi:GTPase SAR1 family protein